MKKTALEFLEESLHSLRTHRYGLSCFFSEQAAQLYVKSALLEIAGDYPRTDYIRSLLAELAKSVSSSSSSENIRRFVHEKRSGISALEDAYTMAPYSGKEYFKEDEEDAIKLANDLVRVVDESTKKKRGGAEA